MIGGLELIVIFLIVLVLFGGKRLVGLARHLRKGLKAIRKQTSDSPDKDLKK